MDIQNILLQVKSGEMSLETAEQMLEKIPYEDLGYAKLDHHRREERDADQNFLPFE